MTLPPRMWMIFDCGVAPWSGEVFFSVGADRSVTVMATDADGVLAIEQDEDQIPAYFDGRGPVEVELVVEPERRWFVVVFNSSQTEHASVECEAA